MIWGIQKNHDSDCYFYLVKVKGYFKKNMYKIIYPNLEFAMISVSHDNSLSIPIYSRETDHSLTLTVDRFLEKSKQSLKVVKPEIIISEFMIYNTTESQVYCLDINGLFIACGRSYVISE